MSPNNPLIYSFIRNRWRDAKGILEDLDSAFVHSLEVLDSAINKGVWLPNLPTPSNRLPVEWHQLLESTADIVQQIDRWELGLAKLELTEETNDREFRFYFNTWVEVGWSLADKVARLISLSCKVYGMGKMRDKFRMEVVDIRDKFSSRTASVHGVADPSKGETGVIARALTEKGYWEANVVLGFDAMAPYLRPSREELSVHSALIPGARDVANIVITQLGEVLSRLDADLYQSGDP